MKTTTKRVEKGWGHEDIVCNSELYCGKIMFIKAEKRASVHYHILKDETFKIIRGKLLLWYSETDEMDNYIILNPGDSFHVKPGLRHQFLGLEDTEFIEFSTQDFPEDSIRLKKGD